MKKDNFFGNFLAIITVFIWGFTFISTKILLKSLSPEEILFSRFFIAFLFLNIFSIKKIEKFSLKKEVFFILLGLTGVTLYFWVENLSLKYTYASNVGLFSSSIPIFTAILAHFLTKEKKFEFNILFGFIFSFIGIFLIIFNGRILKLNPYGDLLAITASVIFAIYSVLLKMVINENSNILITKKIFFYGIIFMIPIIFIKKISYHNFISLSFFSFLNLIFLAVFASALCFIMWNQSVKIIGSVQASNYIYFVPIITMTASSIFLHEKISIIMIIGGILILIGVYITNLKNGTN